MRRCEIANEHSITILSKIDFEVGEFFEEVLNTRAHARARVHTPTRRRSINKEWRLPFPIHCLDHVVWSLSKK